MKPTYELSTAAEMDFRGIIAYTARTWGKDKAASYGKMLDLAVVKVSGGKGVWKDMSGLYPGLRMVHCQRHYVFCLPRAEMPALIVAILHERMNVMSRLASRLK